MLVFGCALFQKWESISKPRTASRGFSHWLVPRMLQQLMATLGLPVPHFGAKKSFKIPTFDFWYTPWNQYSPWKMVVGRLLCAMLVPGRVVEKNDVLFCGLRKFETQSHSARFHFHQMFLFQCVFRSKVRDLNPETVGNRFRWIYREVEINQSKHDHGCCCCCCCCCCSASSCSSFQPLIVQSREVSTWSILEPLSHGATHFALPGPCRPQQRRCSCQRLGVLVCQASSSIETSAYIDGAACREWVDPYPTWNTLPPENHWLKRVFGKG